MSKDQKTIKKHRVEIVEKYKAKGYLYCVYTIRIYASSVKFYKTYSAASREMHRQLENPKIILSTIFELKSFKIII